MTFGTLSQVREILDKTDPNTNVTDTREDLTIERVQSEVYRAMLARILQCNPSGPPTPVQLLAPAAPAASMTFGTLMPNGYRRLVVIVNGGSGFAGSPSLAITGLVGGSLQTDNIAIDGNRRYISRLVFDSIDLTAGRVVANADLIASGGTVEVLENIGELTDIENRWTSGLVLMERAKLLAKESEPPEMHPWIKDAMRAFEAFLERFCVGAEPGTWQGVGQALYRRGTSGDIYGDQNIGNPGVYFP